MEDFFERFPHIIEKIFETLDDKSLTTCREVSKTWQKFIDERNLSWIRIIKIPTILKRGNTYLHIAAQTGQTELLEMILDDEDDKRVNFDALDDAAAAEVNELGTSTAQSMPGAPSSAATKR